MAHTDAINEALAAKAAQAITLLNEIANVANWARMDTARANPADAPAARATGALEAVALTAEMAKHILGQGLGLPHRIKVAAALIAEAANQNA